MLAFDHYVNCGFSLNLCYYVYRYYCHRNHANRTSCHFQIDQICYVCRKTLRIFRVDYGMRNCRHHDLHQIRQIHQMDRNQMQHRNHRHHVTNYRQHLLLGLLCHIGHIFLSYFLYYEINFHFSIFYFLKQKIFNQKKWILKNYLNHFPR